jgi:hypothetical protein
MPMENIKQQLSDVVHNWVTIIMITLFLFPVQPVNALPAKPLVKTEAQLKQETLDAFSKEIYKPSEALTDTELISLLKAVGFDGEGLKKAWAIAKRESNGRPLAYNGNRKTGDNSYGLFQINMIDELGIKRLELFNEKFDLTTKAGLLDPVTNAEITYYMTKGGENWSSWKGLTPRAKEFYLKFPTTVQ